MRQETLLVLRLWRDGESPDAWRYSLRNVRTSEQVSFATFKALCKYISVEHLEEGGRDGTTPIYNRRDCLEEKG